MPRIYSSTTARKVQVEEAFRSLLKDNRREAELMLIRLQSIMRRGPEQKRNVG